MAYKLFPCQGTAWEMRPDLWETKKLRANTPKHLLEDLENTIRRKAASSSDPIDQLLGVNFLKTRATEFYAEKKYGKAIDYYVDAMRCVVGQVHLPTEHAIVPEYSGLDWKIWMDLVLCANNIAWIYLTTGEIVKVRRSRFYVLPEFNNF